MKAILILIVCALTIWLGCDVEKNSNLVDKDYSDSKYALAGLLFFGFFLYYNQEFKDTFNKRK